MSQPSIDKHGSYCLVMVRWWRGWAAVAAVALLALAGCTSHPAGTPTGGSAAAPSTTAGSRKQPSWLPPGAVVHRDLAYGTDPAQQLDVYQPAGASGDPIILMVHGGGWQRGDKAAAAVVDHKVAHYLPRGYVVVSTNYRLSPAVDPVTQAGDVAAALAYVQQHAGARGGSGRKVILMGHSAGANLAALVAANPTYAARANASPWLGTVVLDSAAYNVVQIMGAPHLSLYDPVFGHDTQLWRQASPTLALSGTPHPMLLVCAAGRADSCPQAKTFATAADMAGARTQVDPVTLTHRQIDSQLGAPGVLTSTVDGFLHTLGQP